MDIYRTNSNDVLNSAKFFFCEHIVWKNLIFFDHFQNTHTADIMNLNLCYYYCITWVNLCSRIITMWIIFVKNVALLFRFAVTHSFTQADGHAKADKAIAATVEIALMVISAHSPLIGVSRQSIIHVPNTQYHHSLPSHYNFLTQHLRKRQQLSQWNWRVS